MLPFRQVGGFHRSVFNVIKLEDVKVFIEQHGNYSGFRVAERIRLINCREALGSEQSGVHPVVAEAIRGLAAL